mmetsp:Transcript_103234/g.274526  ORF Transcript_103234/g.274526 Transcript_103234/m.274526 type:complete len:204 (+) Transcript_103234:264-875(+)
MALHDAARRWHSKVYVDHRLARGEALRRRHPRGAPRRHHGPPPRREAPAPHACEGGPRRGDGGHRADDRGHGAGPGRHGARLVEREPRRPRHPHRQQHGGVLEGLADGRVQGESDSSDGSFASQAPAWLAAPRQRVPELRRPRPRHGEGDQGARESALGDEARGLPDGPRGGAALRSARGLVLRHRAVWLACNRSPRPRSPVA